MKLNKFVKYTILLLILSNEVILLNEKINSERKYSKIRLTRKKKSNNKSKIQTTRSKSKLEPVTTFAIIAVIKTVSYFINKYYSYHEMLELNKLSNLTEKSSNQIKNIGLQAELSISESCGQMKTILSWNRILIVTKTLDTYKNYLRILNKKANLTTTEESNKCIPTTKKAKKAALKNNYEQLSKIFNELIKLKKEGKIKTFKKIVEFDHIKSNSCKDFKSIDIGDIPKEIANLTKHLIDRNSYLTDLVCSNDNEIQKNIRSELNKNSKEIEKLDKMIDENDDKILFSMIGKFSSSQEEKLKFSTEEIFSTVGEMKYTVEIDGEEVEKFLIGGEIGGTIIEHVNTIFEVNKIIQDLDEKDEKTEPIIDLIDFTQKQTISLISNNVNKELKEKLNKGSNILSGLLGLLKSVLDYLKEDDPFLKHKKKLEIYNSISSLLDIAVDYFQYLALPVAAIKLVVDFVIKRNSYNHTVDHVRKESIKLESKVLNYQNQFKDINLNNNFYKCQALSETQEYINNFTKFFKSHKNDEIPEDIKYLTVIENNFENLSVWKMTLIEICKVYSQICIDSDIIKYSTDEVFIRNLRTTSYYGVYSDLMVVRNFNELEIALRLGYDYITGSFDVSYKEYKKHDYSDSTVGDMINTIKSEYDKQTINEFLNKSFSILLGCRGCSTKSYISSIAIISKDVALEKFPNSSDPVLETFSQFYSIEKKSKGDIRVLLWENNNYIVYELKTIKVDDIKINAFKHVINVENPKFISDTYDLIDGVFENNFVDLSRFVENVEIIDRSKQTIEIHDRKATTFEFILVKKECYDSVKKQKYKQLIHIFHTVQYSSEEFYFGLTESFNFRDECVIILEKNQYDGYFEKGEKFSNKLNSMVKIYENYKNDIPDDKLRLFNKQAYITGLDLGYIGEQVIIDFILEFFRKVFNEENVSMSYLHLDNIKKFYIIYHKENIYSTTRNLSNKIENSESQNTVCKSDCLFSDDNSSELKIDDDYSGLKHQYRDYVSFFGFGSNLDKCITGFNKFFGNTNNHNLKNHSDHNITINANEKIFDSDSEDTNSNIYQILPQKITSNDKFWSNCNYVVYVKKLRFNIIKNNSKSSYYRIGIDFTNQFSPTITIDEDGYGPGIHSLVWIEYIFDNTKGDEKLSSHIERHKLSNLEEVTQNGYSLYIYKGNSEFELKVNEVKTNIKFRLFYKFKRILNKMRSDICPKINGKKIRRRN